jgi:Tol biopolymer transport system component
MGACRLRLWLGGVRCGVVVVVLASGGAAGAASVTTQLASASSAGVPGNDVSLAPAMSADGRYVAFQSFASNLVAGDTNGATDIFVRDHVAGTTRRVSVSSTGGQANAGSALPSISADGRYVVFVSNATNLVSGDTNRVEDVFIRDRARARTRRLSIPSGVGGQANDGSAAPEISADGRYVVFQSTATNLVTGDTTGGPFDDDIFVRDRATATTRRISVSSTGAQANGASYGASISADGRFVAFQSLASNLVAGDTNRHTDIFVRDRATSTTRRVNVAAGSGAQANNGSGSAVISADGRYVAYTSYATNLVAGDTNGRYDVFLRDRATATTRRLSVSSAGAQGNGGSSADSISAHGRYVAFSSTASNLTAGDTTHGFNDVFVRDRGTGTTRKVSISSSGAQANAESGFGMLSGDGRYIAFESAASNLVAGTNPREDIFLRGPLW